MKEKKCLLRGETEFLNFMIQSAESVIIFTGITEIGIVNFVTASLLVSVVKN